MNIDERSENNIPHNKKSLKLFKYFKKIDKENGYPLDFKSGGDGDNGEILLYILDIYFEEKMK